MQKNKMKYHYYIIGTVIFSIIAGIGCKQSEKKAEVKKTDIDSTAAFILQKVEVNKQVNFPAELTSIEGAEIFAKVSGYVNNIKADIGDRVQKGQVLAILDAPEMSANYAQSNADIQTPGQSS